MFISNISFGYRTILKEYFLKGLLPTVKYGIYGGELTQDNVTIEHLRPRCEGGGTELSNIALATWDNNHRRKNKPLCKVLTQNQADIYLKQFEDVDLPDFNGKQYINWVKGTLEKLLNSDNK